MNYPAMSDRALLLMLADRSERVEELLLGNGQPGIVARLASTEMSISALDRSRDERTPLVGEFRALQEKVGGIERQSFRRGAVGGVSAGTIFAVLAAVLARIGVHI